ncbi:MAG: diguanylate cyclase/phosphodiesterase (GGDEF & EAL domains) with PAS/PAC sensor(s) [uncultured Sulfurovum sp.]|uniref:Diguanylate cyclase/phosphodiesterase (GGDEF & EAL domains) with PAS/PAC sensor(S) n=1 Tax=uncultured Sulfurovum sp. TaxID=269237 RepID=A0A6S6S8N0_9BACT|nr:MAG: diguanylate cyclase/phosphodiesterase (GGDEF & EAL domains) with PAS/PAC sensor(s) [uncultured Sulfurovum sp.]
MKKFFKLQIISFYLFFGIFWFTMFGMDNVYSKSLYIVSTAVLLYLFMNFCQKKHHKTNLILTSIFQVIPDLLFIMKEDTTIIDYRAQTENDLYVKPENFLGHKMQDILPEKVTELFNKHFAKALTNQSLEVFEYELEINGQRKYFEARMAKLLVGNNLMLISREITEQVLNQEKLEFQSELVEQSLAATNVINEKGVFSYVNDAYVKMWGYDSKEEIIGTSPAPHCVDFMMPQTIIERVEREKESLFSFKARRKNATSFNALMAVKYLDFKEKKFYIGSTMDVSEQEKLIRQYETMFNNSREGIFLHELDGIIIDVNPYVEKLHNVSKEEIIGLNIRCFVKEEDSLKFTNFTKELSKKGYVELEMELMKLDGTLFFASIEAHVLELDGREVVQGTIRDLTEKVHTELLVTRSKKIFESLDEGVVITDLKGSITEVNKAFETITGYSQAEVLGNRMSMLKSGIQDALFYQELWSSLKNDFRWSGKVYNKHKNGELYTSFLAISTIKNNEGEVQNYIGIFTDKYLPKIKFKIR